MNDKKDTREKYEKVVKLVKDARKEAEKFIKANNHLDPQLQIRYLQPNNS